MRATIRTPIHIRNRISSATHVRIAEEEHHQRPQEDQRRQHEMRQRNPGDLARQPLRQLNAIRGPLELLLQMPVVLERRPRTTKQDQLNAVPQPATEDHAFTKHRHHDLGRYQVLVHHRHHVVLEAQYPMVNVQLGEVLLVYAHLLLGLDVADLALHLVPRQVVQFVLTNGSFDLKMFENPSHNNNHNHLHTSAIFSTVL